MNFNVGSKVCILPYAEILAMHGGREKSLCEDECGWNTDMEYYCGMTVTIKEDGDRWVHIEEDQGEFYWLKKYLHPVTAKVNITANALEEFL